ncbi:MAG TPA: DciA family protein [Rhodoglobus sp.]|nr:DciA family protein [Rhodoglobus sp.]
MSDQVPEHVAVWLRFRRVFGDGTARAAVLRKARVAREPKSLPFTDGRDPLGLGAVIDGLTAQLGWRSPLAKSELIIEWPTIVGAETAQHAQPAGIEDGVLTVRCDSTAWAQQLRLMRSQVTTQIAKRFPDAGIESVTFLGPDAPSWKRGPRSIPGRGPRDTYG